MSIGLNIARKGLLLNRRSSIVKNDKTFYYDDRIPNHVQKIARGYEKAAGTYHNGENIYPNRYNNQNSKFMALGVKTEKSIQKNVGFKKQHVFDGIILDPSKVSETIYLRNTPLHNRIIQRRYR